MGIQNTTDFYRQNPEVGLLAAMSEGTTGFIEGMEAAGQRQLVNSDRLPVKLNSFGDYGDEAFTALGFTFGEPDPADTLFRPATLPAGWSRKSTDHSMWSKIVDEYGRERVSIFYKAAFYDRDAFMSLETPVGYIRSFLWAEEDKGLPVLDDAWLTPQVADEACAAIRDGELKQAREYAGYAEESTRTNDNRAALREIAAKREAEAAKAEGFRIRIAEMATPTA